MAELCRRLEGIPLVIELAAARLGALSFDDLMSRLDQALELLGSGGRSHHRHRSLRATLDWSYDLLAADEQALYRRSGCSEGLSVSLWLKTLSRSGSTRVAAGVAHLVDASLLVRQGDSYRQLDLIRADAIERLSSSGEEHEVLGRLVDWALRALHKAFQGETRPTWEQPSRPPNFSGAPSSWTWPRRWQRHGRKSATAAGPTQRHSTNWRRGAEGPSPGYQPGRSWRGAASTATRR